VGGQGVAVGLHSLAARRAGTGVGGVGELGNTGGAPVIVSVRSGEAGGAPEAPDGQVEGQDSGNERGLEGHTVREEEEGVAKGEGRGNIQTAAVEKEGPGLADNATGAIDVGYGVLAGRAVKAGGNVRKGDLVLMAHATRRGQGIVNKGNMVINEGGGGGLAELESFGKEGETSERRILGREGAGWPGLSGLRKAAILSLECREAGSW